MAELAIPLITAGVTAGGTYLAANANKPKLQAPVPMPDPNDPASMEARRKKQADIEATKGRASTVLDSNNEVPTYVHSQLGL